MCHILCIYIVYYNLIVLVVVDLSAGAAGGVACADVAGVVFFFINYEYVIHCDTKVYQGDVVGV